MSASVPNPLIVKVLWALALSAAVYFRVHVYLGPYVLGGLLLGSFNWADWEARWVTSALVVTLEVLAVGPALGLFPHAFDVERSRVGVTAVGAVYLAILLVVAVRSEKWWPSWVAAFQLVLVASHPLFVIKRDSIQPWAYASGIVIWTWLELIAIGCGVIAAWAGRGAASRDRIGAG